MLRTNTPVKVVYDETKVFVRNDKLWLWEKVQRIGIDEYNKSHLSASVSQRGVLRLVSNETSEVHYRACVRCVLPQLGLSVSIIPLQWASVDWLATRRLSSHRMSVTFEVGRWVQLSGSTNVVRLQAPPFIYSGALSSSQY